MSETSKQFHLSDLLAVTSGRLLSLRGMEGVYGVIDHVTGQSHATHQLPRAADVVAPELLRQFPWLADLPLPGELQNEGDLYEWWVRMGPVLGRLNVSQFVDVQALPEGAYVGREPHAELQEMAAGRPVVQLGDDAPDDLDGGAR